MCIGIDLGQLQPTIMGIKPNVFPSETEASFEGLESDTRSLEATLKVGVREFCPIRSIDTDADIVQISPRNEQCVIEFRTMDLEESCKLITRYGGKCDCGEGAITDDSEEIVQASTERRAGCVCRVFEMHDCVPRIDGHENSNIVVQTYLSDRQKFASLVKDLQLVSDHVQVLQIKEIDPPEDRAIQVTIDIAGLTDKQRECLRVALGEGYFDSPRGISQSELAAELGISSSALSRRLRTIEKRLFEQVGFELDSH